MFKHFSIFRTTIGCVFLLSFTEIKSQDTSYIKVHFLYGSRPLKAYKQTEPKWFGGILGGHVGIEGDSNQILNFVPHGTFHLLPTNNIKHSKYTLDSVSKFYSRLGGQHPDSAKQTIIIIPVSIQQKLRFDSIAALYLTTTPYDYALIGMRCGAATYEILAQLGIVKPLSLSQTSVTILYPKKLRLKLLAKAKAKGWTVIKHNGTCRRKWESDN
jgi:hypothetical protein